MSNRPRTTLLALQARFIQSNRRSARAPKTTCRFISHTRRGSFFFPQHTPNIEGETHDQKKYSSKVSHVQRPPQKRGRWRANMTQDPSLSTCQVSELVLVSSAVHTSFPRLVVLFLCSWTGSCWVETAVCFVLVYLYIVAGFNMEMPQTVHFAFPSFSAFFCIFNMFDYIDKQTLIEFVKRLVI